MKLTAIKRSISIIGARLPRRVAADGEADSDKKKELLDRARKSCEAAATILRKLNADFREIPAYARELANVLNSQSNILIDLNLNEQAAAQWREAHMYELREFVTKTGTIWRQKRAFARKVDVTLRVTSLSRSERTTIFCLS